MCLESDADEPPPIFSNPLTGKTHNTQHTNFTHLAPPQHRSAKILKRNETHSTQNQTQLYKPTSSHMRIGQEPEVPLTQNNSLEYSASSSSQGQKPINKASRNPNFGLQDPSEDYHTFGQHNLLEKPTSIQERSSESSDREQDKAVIYSQKSDEKNNSSAEVEVGQPYRDPIHIRNLSAINDSAARPIHSIEEVTEDDYTYDSILHDLGRTHNRQISH